MFISKNNLAKNIISCFICLGLFSLSSSFARSYNNQFEEIEKANKYFKAGLYQEARAILWEVIEAAPEDPDAYINLASTYIKEENFETAIRLLKKAEEKSDKDYFQREILFYNLGLAYYYNDNYQQARQYFGKAVGVYPDFAEAYFYLGKVSQKLNNPENTYLNFFKANYLFSKKNNGYYTEIASKKLNNLQNSHTFNKEALGKSLSANADQAQKSGNLQKAVHFLEKSMELYPQDVTTYRKLAKLYIDQKAYYNAAIYLNKLKEVGPSSEVYLELGRVYRALGKYELALKHFEKAASLDKDNPQIPYEISLTHMKSNQYHTADKFIQKADQKAAKKRDRKVLEKINQMESEIDRKLSPKARVKAKQRKRTQNFDYFNEAKTNGNAGQLNKGYFTPAQD